MKKETAFDLHDRLRDVNLQGWNLHYPEYKQEHRRITYRIRLSHTPFNYDTLIPEPPVPLILALKEYEVSGNQLRHVTSESEEEDYKCDHYAEPTEIPRFEYIIDNHEADEIPRTAEEERQIQLERNIKDAFDFAKSVNIGGLAEKYETVGEILTASEDELRENHGVGERTAGIILQKRSPELARRLEKLGKKTDRTILIVEKNEHGTFEPVYSYKTIEQINREFRGAL